MTNPVNVTFIMDKLLNYLRGSADTYVKSELVPKISELAERFAPSNTWFVHTMNRLFELAGDLVRPEMMHNLMRLIAEGAGGDDDDEDRELRSHAVHVYTELLKKPVLPEPLLIVISWTLGEYGYLLEDDGMSTVDVVDYLCDILDRSLQKDETRAYAHHDLHV